MHTACKILYASWQPESQQRRQRQRRAAQKSTAIPCADIGNIRDRPRARPRSSMSARMFTALRRGALLCSLSLGGCATTAVVWTKTDGSDADAAADLAECRELAADEAWRMSWDRRWPPRFYDPRFMPPFYTWPMPFWYDFPVSVEREHALVDFCMHSKGYRLEATPH